MTNSFILDCSVALSWCFVDEDDEYSRQIQERLNDFKALVPSLWKLEIVNGLLMAEKRNRLDIARSARFLELLESFPIYTSDLSFSNAEIMNVARNYKLTSYDATYLLHAMHHGYPLATKDKALVRACNETGVQLFN